MSLQVEGICRDCIKLVRGDDIECAVQDRSGICSSGALQGLSRAATPTTRILKKEYKILCSVTVTAHPEMESAV